MKAKRERTLRRAAARETRKFIRGGMAAGLVAFGACGESHGPALDTSIASGGGRASAIDAGSTDRDARAASVPDTRVFGTPHDAGTAKSPIPSTEAVSRNAVARNILYSWTTKAQIAELQANPVLLTRSENSDGKRPHSSTVIASLGEAGDALGQVLASAKFQKGRYAWSNAWATVRGWPDESYGDQLLRIVLKAEAWIAIVEAQTTRVVDMNNADVTPEEALAHPERIAAAYFVTEGGAGPNACGTWANGCGTGAYREYFVNNESMVLEWSFGTQAVLDEIERSVDLIEELRDQIATAPIDNAGACEFAGNTYCAWSVWEPVPLNTPLHAYQRALALTSEFYLPTVTNMDALIAALKASVFTPDPFEHRP